MTLPGIRRDAIVRKDNMNNASENALRALRCSASPGGSVTLPYIDYT